MKLLKLRIDGVTLFKDKRLELDFIAADRVLSDEEGNFADVFRCRWDPRSILRM